MKKKRIQLNKTTNYSRIDKKFSIERARSVRVAQTITRCGQCTIIEVKEERKKLKETHQNKTEKINRIKRKETKMKRIFLFAFSRNEEPLSHTQM